MMRIAFVVCCYNGAGRLPGTLAALARQSPASRVVLVDNASTDGTAETAAEIWHEHGEPLPLRIVAEPRQGLAHARARGLAEAAALDCAVACFVDDDNVLEGDWTAILSDRFAADDAIGAIGGCGVPAFPESGKPAWFDDLQGSFACGPQGPPGYVPAERGFLYGAGLAVRLDAWRSISAGFAPRLVGRTGGRMLAGDDAELCMSLQAAGWRLWHAPELRFAHVMPAARLEPAVVESMFFGFGVSSRVIGELHRRVQGRAPGMFAHPRLYRAVARLRCWRRGWFGAPRRGADRPATDRFYAAGCCVAI